MKKKISFLLICILAMVVCPIGGVLVSAAENPAEKVHVIIENTTYTKEDGAAWDDTLLDEYIVPERGMDMASALKAALDQKKIDHQYGGSGFQEIQGIGETNGGSWMGMLNDWFINGPLDTFEVEAGDEVRLVYSVDGGADVGNRWDSEYTYLEGLKFSAGELSPEFKQDVTEYILSLGTTEKVAVTPEAVNKSFQVRIYKGKNPDLTEAGYKRGAEIPVANGDAITIVSGGEGWPSSSSAEHVETRYTVTIRSEIEPNDPPVLKDEGEAPQKQELDLTTDNKNFTIGLSKYFEDPDGDDLTYTVSINGAEPITADADYTWTPTKGGNYTLEFRAHDKKNVSEPLTVEITVKDHKDYTITTDNAQNGSITLSNKTNEGPQNGKGQLNDIIEVKLNPQEGFALKSLTIKNKETNQDIDRWQMEELSEDAEAYNHTFRFEMPASDVSVSVVFKKSLVFEIIDGNWELCDGICKLFDEENNELLPFSDQYYTNEDGALDFQFHTIEGVYNYELYDMDQSLVAKGSIDLDKSLSEAGTVTFSIWHLIIQFDYSLDPLYTFGGIVTLKDAAGQEIAPQYSSSTAYSYYILSDVNTLEGNQEFLYFTYELLDDRVDATITNEKYKDMKVPIDEKAFNNGVTINIKQAAGINTMTYIINEGAEPRFYVHPGKAYKEMDPIEPVGGKGVPCADDPGMEKWTYTFPRSADPVDMHLLIASGGDTGYELTYDARNYTKNDIRIELKEKKDGYRENYGSNVVSDDLYTNVKDEGNQIIMKVGDAPVRLETYRTNQTVMNTTTNVEIEPEKEYKVISGDSVEVSKQKGKEGRYYVELTPKKAGVSIIQVTYGGIDAIGKRYFNPIAPVHTGIVFVNVVPDEKTAATCETLAQNSGITITEYDRETKEPKVSNLTKYDTIYFAKTVTWPDGTVETAKVDDDKASYREYVIDPSISESGKVYYHAPVQIDPSFSEDTWKEAEKVEGGYNIRLKSGRNLIRIEAGGGVSRYFALNAMETDVTVSNKTRSDGTFQKGDKVTVSLTNLELPVKKMTAIYNPGFPNNTYISYLVNGEEQIGRRSQYTVYQDLSFTLQKGGELELKGGQIRCTHMGSGLDSHCMIPADGLGHNFNASTAKNDPYFCILPDITIPVENRAKKVEALIDEINAEHPLLTIRKVVDAWKAYNDLTEEEKAEVENSQTLLEIYEDYKSIIDLIVWIDSLKGEPSMSKASMIDEKLKEYEKLPAEQRLMVDSFTKFKDYIDYIQKVRDLITEINKLPSLNDVKPENRDAIQKLLDTYNSLTDDQKAYVLNYDTLKKLGDRVKDLTAVQEVIDLIRQIDKLTEENYESKEALILKARQLYELLSADQKKLVTNIGELTAAEELLNTFKSDPDIRKLIELLKELRDGTDGKGNGPLNQTGDTWEVWKNWADYVKNVRAMVDRIDQSRRGLITNLADLEAAEKQVQRIRVSYVEGLIRALPGDSTVDYSNASVAATSEAAAYAEPLETAETAEDIVIGDEAEYTETAEAAEAAMPVEGYEAEPAAAGRQMTEAELSAIAVAKDEYDSLSEAERALMAQEASSDVTKLERLDEKAATYTGYVEAVMQKFLDRVEACLGSDGKVTRLDIAAASDLVARYKGYPAERKEVLDKLVTAKGTTGAKLMKELTTQTDTAVGEIAETERIDELIRSLPTAVNADNLEAVKAEVAAIEEAIAKLSDDAKSYLYQMNRLDALKKILAEMEEILDPDAPLGDIPLEEAKPEVTAKSAGYNSVKITWTEVSGAQSYRIYRQKNGKGSYTKIATVDAAKTSYTNKKLVTNRIYRYKVRAVAKTEDGTIYSKYGVSAKVKPVPAKAAITKVAAGKRYLKVAWKKVSGASGYVVYRASSKNGKYKAVKTIKSGKTVSWKNTGLTGGKTYYYKVRAYRTVSGKKVYGSYSAKASGKAKK